MLEGLGIWLWVALAVLFAALVGLVLFGFHFAEKNGIVVPRKVKTVRLANLIIVFVLLVAVFLYVRSMG